PSNCLEATCVRARLESEELKPTAAPQLFRSCQRMGASRHTRYQAAVLREGALLLLRCVFRDGPTVWILPGGGREEGESEEDCVVREVREETALTVRVQRLLSDVPAEPPDGTYARWRTYLCTVLRGEAAPGGGEGASAELIDVTW